MEDTGGAVYADLRRYYGEDMAGLFHDPPTTSPAKILALIQELPMESKTSAILRGVDNSYGWSTSEYLLAFVIDAVREGTFASIQTQTKKKLRPPDRLPVPGMESTNKPANNFLKMAKEQFVMNQRR